MFMDSCISHQGAQSFLPSRRDSRDVSLPGAGVSVFPSRGRVSARPIVVVAVGAGASRCEPGSSLNAPLEPRSSQGRFLRSVLLNKRQIFHYAATDELQQLAEDREGAIARMVLSSGTDEKCLHRRIAQLKERQCQSAVQDIMYMLIFYKFSEIRVPLVPKLSRCIYNGRLEIWPSKDWELESIHVFDILKLVKEHVSAVIGLRVNSSANDNWAITQIQKLHLAKVYATSILYGYFLKSASLRHQLECSLSDLHHLSHHRSVFGCSSARASAETFKGQELKHREQLRYYISGFTPEALQRCAKPRSLEAKRLAENQSLALFGAEKTDEVIVTSFSSLKRLVLEAVAFGSFLWDTEDYVDGVYKLKANDSAKEEEEEEEGRNSEAGGG